ncbi:MAG: hypothetical protein A2283_04400 [Lentisphaerae bacterium RIFOXYA12_FULL_48_11]|nr:MAG: hypothetical protein A2283_04400 [Lentisphaerae bacterium RIFOXYA12_FULL_48_11]
MFVIERIFLSVKKLRIFARRASFSWLIILLPFFLSHAYAEPSATITVTVSLSSTNSGPVNLGSITNFMIFAGSAITSGGGIINGDIGLSPNTGTNITGLTAAQVNGTIYAVDNTGPAGSVMDPGLLTTAKNDLTAAYNDTAARTNVTFVNPGSGNIGGMNLLPGIYKFTSSALITGTNVTLTGGANDVWIFQIGSTLTVGSGIQVILAG